jgi:uncharacterized membrane protein YbhN (UPF0104 family)
MPGPSFLKAAGLFILKLAVSIICLAWAVSQIDFQNSIFSRPDAIDYRWLALGAALAGITVILTAIRWWFFLRAQNLPVSLGRSIELTMIGNLFSLVSLAGIGGDAARILLLIRDHPGRKLVITMAVLVDHLAGMGTLALLFFVISAAQFDALANQSILGREVIRFAWIYLGGGLLLVALMFLFASPPIHRRIHGNRNCCTPPPAQGISTRSDASPHLVDFEFILGNAAYARRAEIRITRLNASQTAQILVSRLRVSSAPAINAPCAI